jgi:hypothetical protein
MKKGISFIGILKVFIISFAMIITSLIGPQIISTISANGFDLTQIVDVLLGRVESQDQKIIQLEKELEELKEKLEQEKEKPQEEVVVVKPTPEEPKPEEIKLEEPKPTEPKPEVKPTEPKPVVKPTEPKPINSIVVNPTVSVYMKDTSFKLIWTKDEGTQLKGYKVVFSPTNSKPSYPNDGYLVWITDKNQHYTYVDNSIKYQGGDINGYLQPDTEYFVAITYVYQDQSVTTEAIIVKTPASFNTPDSEPLPPSTLSLSAKMQDTSFKLIWTKEISNQLVEYKVVISQFNNLPSFPNDGYLVCIEDKNLHYTYVDNKTQYTGGDFYGYLLADTEYYISVTYVYQTHSVTTAPIKIKTPTNLYVPTR